MDRESAITHLQIIHTWAEFARERDLQYFTAKHLENIAKWSDDAIALLKEQEKPNGKCVNECECFDSAYERGKQDTLKEQEAVKPVRDKLTGRIWLCGNCGTYVGFEDNDPHDPNEYDKYCRECGRPVLWEGR